VTLPDGSQLAVAAFVKGAAEPETAERAIARASRALYDYFTRASGS